jgi:subtilisin family serine protease
MSKELKGGPPRIGAVAERRARALSLTALIVVVVVVGAGCTAFGPSRTDWAFAAIQATDMATAGLSGQGVTVAIIDTGIDLTSPYLEGVALAGWLDLINHRDEPYDDNGHGTAMASILVGTGALAGGAPRVSLIMIKAIAGDGTGDDATVADAINIAVANGAEIISLSLGGAHRFILGSSAAQATGAAANLGVLVVASAGNDGGPNDDGRVATPGSSNHAISVGAVDRENVLAPFSSKGRNSALNLDPNKKPEVVAPGVGITVAWTGGATSTVSGTSPAAVFVAVGLALLLEAHPTLQRAGATGVSSIKAAIAQTALKVSGQNSPHDDFYGYGLFQASAASSQL